MLKKFTIAVTVWALVAATFSPARADILWHFAQVTCLPEAQQFAVRTFNQYNTPHPPGHGIFTAEDLKAAPQHCEMPAFERAPAITIEVRGIATPPGNGHCEGEGSQAVEIVVNEKLAAIVQMTDCGISRDTMTTVQGNGVAYKLLHCVNEFADNTPTADSYTGTTCNGQEITK